LARSEIQRSARLDVNIENAARYVRSLLPEALSTRPITTAWHSAPSTALGGDIFHYHWLDDEHFVTYLIDVCGHGIGAALHSVSVSNLLRQRSLPNVDFRRPASVLQALNAALPMERYGAMYFTLWYGVYRPIDRQLQYASAGHPPALLFSDHGRHRLELATENPPIGVIESVEYVDASITLAIGSSLFLYSDGVFDIVKKDGNWWSCEEFAAYLQECVKNQVAAPGKVFQAIRGFTRGEQFPDDFSLLLLQF
jgi:sigma-B regulation protein RsbU (phosphoserine phosphatase)